MTAFLPRLQYRANLSGTSIDPKTLERLGVYFELLSRWNRRLNLSGFDLDALSDSAIDRIFVEPVFGAGLCSGVDSLLDLGSGGGSPALPMILALKPSRAVLIEAKERKCVFLREAIRSLGVETSVQVERSRFEALSGRAEYQESFDLVTSRAVRLGNAELEKVSAFVSRSGSLCVFVGEVDVPETPSLMVQRTIELPAPLRGRIQLLGRR